jgi:uncharacterized protein
MDPRKTPRTQPAGKVLVAMVVCLGLWALLVAPLLRRDADASPFGARRTAALVVLRPLAALSDVLHLSRLTGGVERALGRDPQAPAGGEIDLGDLPAVPRPSPGSTPSPLPHARDPLRAPTAGNKLRVVVVGDSQAVGLSTALSDYLSPPLVRVWNQARTSTGLARLDYFNWLGAMRQIVDGFQPDVVVVMIGENDDQAQRAPDGSAIPVGSVEWVRSYRDRVERFLRIATSRKARVVWVGLPITRDRARWTMTRRLNDIYRSSVSERRGALYVDTWDLLQTPGGGYSAFRPNEHGVEQLMGAPDGIHLAGDGYGYLARILLRQVVDAWGLDPRTLQGFALGT